uniref:Uncharacterized protein n=1 Tax=Cacopsylla melanoneura TaxID=428564 RepID=A0A8D9AAJ7_9HEMI
MKNNRFCPSLPVLVKYTFFLGVPTLPFYSGSTPELCFHSGSVYSPVLVKYTFFLRSIPNISISWTSIQRTINWKLNLTLTNLTRIGSKSYSVRSIPKMRIDLLRKSTPGNLGIFCQENRFLEYRFLYNNKFTLQ